MSDQLTSTDGMSDAEIAKATREGRFDALLSGKAHDDTPVTYDADWLANASPEAIAKAFRTSKLDGLL